MASQQEGCGSDSVSSLHILNVPEWLLSRISGFLPESKIMQVGLGELNCPSLFVCAFVYVCDPVTS